MSGGRWNYQELRIREQAPAAARFLEAVAQSEQICDWAESGDTGPEEAGRELYALWVKTFNEVYGS